MENSNDKKHLVVCVHGFMGLPKTVNFVAEQLHKKHDVLILVSNSNSSWWTGTNEGVDKSGERLANEVTEIINKNPSLEKISFIGVSMGGLIARYACALLYDKQGTGSSTIGGLSPQNFATFATPHLGARFGNINWLTEQYISKFPLVKNATDQMFLRDAPFDIKTSLTNHKSITTHDELSKFSSNPKEIPLLLEMSIPGSIFYESLVAFKTRSLYANIEKDHRVSYQSGAIWPFKLVGEVWKRPFVYIENHPNIVDHKEKDFSWTPTNEEGEVIKINENNMETLYPLDSPEWETAKNLNKMKWTRYNCHFNGWFASFLTHSMIHVAFESIHSEGRNVVEHFVNDFVV